MIRLLPATIVLDSWAIMAYLEDEPAAEQVEMLILSARELGKQLTMSTINIGEVWYNTAQRESEAEADRVVANLRQLGIEFVVADWELTRQAAAYKSSYPMAYADCFAAALAKINDAELITGDPEFKQLESEVRIRWI